MNTSTKISLLATVALVAVFTLAAQVIPVRLQTIKQTEYTTNVGELTRDVLVGQTFKSEQANLSGVAIMFATYSNRLNTAPIEFHLRQSYDDPRDLRVARVEPKQLGDNQLYRFTFEAIPESKGKTFFFFIVSPEGVPGNAVTVDLDTRNPYHLGSAFVVRTNGSSLTDPQVVARSGKQTQDIGFATFHTVPLRTAVVTNLRAAVYHFITSWSTERSRYLVLGQALLQGILFLAVLMAVNRWGKHLTTESPLARRTILVFLTVVMMFGLLVRLQYAQELPVTDDEGNYLYDAWSLRQGTLAGGDGYVKAPLMVIWVAIWQTIVGNTVLAGRVASIVIGVATTIPIYFIGRYLKDRQTGVVAAAAWSLLGAVVLAHTYVHTQPVALFFGIAGIAMIWSAFSRYQSGRQPSLFHQPHLPTWRLITGGMLLGLGVASRKSILAVGLVPLLLAVGHLPTWRQRGDAILKIGIGFVIVLAAFVAIAYGVYGPVGAYEALGIASAEDGAQAPEESEIAKVRSYSLRGMTPFFRESMPLILFSLMGWGFVLETWLRRVFRTIFIQKPSRHVAFLFDQIIPKILWVIPLLSFLWCLNFFFEYEGEAFMFFGMSWLWHSMGVLMIIAALWPRPRGDAFVFEDGIVKASTQPLAPPNVIGSSAKLPAFSPFALIKQTTPSLAPLLLLPGWFGGLAFFYLNWIKFHANYINEFLPPLVIFSGLGALGLWQRLWQPYWVDSRYPFRELFRKLIALMGTAVIIWALFLSNYITFKFEHTGTFAQRALREAAAWAKANIPLTEPIFTGAALVPYLSGHQTALDIAHPRWYAYEFTRKDPRRLNTFLPSIEDMLAAYRASNWFLLDKQTGFSFLMEYSEIEQGLSTEFVAEKGIENGSNTLTFYRRK